MHQLRTAWIALPLILAFAGCAPKLPSIQKQYPVRGKVLLTGGQPLIGGQVTFYPFGESVVGRAPAFGFPGKDGSFQLTAFKTNDGLAPGAYKVVIAPRDEGEPGTSNANGIPKSYRSRDTTPIQIEIKAEENDLDPFVLK
jgi:hypothetical protein